MVDMLVTAPAPTEGAPTETVVPLAVAKESAASLAPIEEACPVPEYSEIEPNAPPEETGPYGTVICCCCDPRLP